MSVARGFTQVAILGLLFGAGRASADYMRFGNNREYWDDSKVSEDGTAELMGHTDAVTAVDVSQDGGTILSASVDGTVRLWNAGSKNVRTMYFNDDEAVTSAVLLPDGKRAVSGSESGVMRYFDGPGPTKSWQAHHGAVRVLARDRRGDLIASGGDDGAVYVWSTDDWSQRVLRESGSPARSLSFDPQAKRLVGSFGDGTAIVWSLANGESRELRVGGAALGSAAFSPDGRRLAIAVGPGTVAVLDGKSYEPIETASSPSAEISVLRYSDDGRFIATAGEYVTAHLWSAHPLAAVGILSGHRARVKALAFSPDGRSLITGSADRDLRVFNLGQYRANRPIATASEGPAPAADVDIPYRGGVPTDPKILAVVIGIERYSRVDIPRADYAASDAKSFAKFLQKRWGIAGGNLLLLTDADATRATLNKSLGPWLKNRATAARRVVVFFSGHGAPDAESGDSYLVPYDGDPDYVRETSIRLSDLYRRLSALPVKDVRVILDACFSGRGARSLIAKGMRPLVEIQTHGEAIGKNTVVLAATGPNQAGTSYERGRHGMMSYFLLKGLRGAADKDKDGRITTVELYDYVRDSVEREALKSNVRETPMLMPNEAEADRRGALDWRGSSSAKVRMSTRVSASAP